MKSKEITGILDSLTASVFGVTRSQALQWRVCVNCRQPVRFKTMEPIEQREYRLSAFCGECQSTIFTEEPEREKK